VKWGFEGGRVARAPADGLPENAEKVEGCNVGWGEGVRVRECR
jgi:hypothetical protein